MTENQISVDCRFIERLATIAELVISPYPTISQQFLGFKKLSFVGGINGFQASQKAVRAMTYLNPRYALFNDDITRFTWVDQNSNLQSKYITD